MAANTTMVHVRVDEKIKAPNATSRAAITETNKIIKSRRTRFATADECHKRKSPLARAS